MQEMRLERGQVHCSEGEDVVHDKRVYVSQLGHERLPCVGAGLVERVEEGMACYGGVVVQEERVLVRKIYIETEALDARDIWACSVSIVDQTSQGVEVED